MGSQPPAPRERSSSGDAPAPEMWAGEPTVIMSPPQESGQPGGQRARGFWLWPRTLRWRLIASYVVILLIVLVTLGIALNVVISRALYSNEFSFFQTEAVAAVSATQTRFDALTLGSQPTCADALPYEEAFRQAIAAPIIASHPGTIQGVYLLDGSGQVLAPLSAQTASGAAPYLQLRRLHTLETRANGVFNGVGGSGAAKQLADAGYISLARPAPYGVELIALRYYTDSRCGAAPRTALGYVEIVTTFRRTQVVLATLRYVLALIVFGIFALGILLGSPLISAALSPLSRLTRAARRVAAGDLSQRARLSHADDEIGQLGATFDAMLARIEAAFAARQRSEERMRQFIADASHELRTPLTSIRGNTDVLLRGAKDDPETTERVLLATRREAERMSRLVTDLLTLARLDAGREPERRLVDLVALAGESVDQARILAGERQVLMRTDGGGRLMVLGDPDQLKQVLLVLLDNALKYGRQDVSGWARVSVGRRAGQAMVMVDDNGPGIPPADLPHIFDRFYRAGRAGRAGRPRRTTDGATPSGASKAEGSGLGLSIAQAIAQAHGGSLTAQSAAGGGAAFLLTLPMAPDQGAPQRRTEQRLSVSLPAPEQPRRAGEAAHPGE